MKEEKNINHINERGERVGRWHVPCKDGIWKGTYDRGSQIGVWVLTKKDGKAIEVNYKGMIQAEQINDEK